MSIYTTFSAGSKLDAAIADGPEALQKFIHSGQIEELHDVMPHDDEHEYSEDAAYVEENNVPRIEPSRIDAKRWDKNPRFTNADHDSDMRIMDQNLRYTNSLQYAQNNRDRDMRNVTRDIDFRNSIINQEADFHDLMDFDDRRVEEEEFRYNHDEDYVDYGEEEDYDEYYTEPRNWQPRSVKFNRNFDNGPNNFGNFRQNPGFNRFKDHYQDHYQEGPSWNGSPDGFRGRGRRGGPRGRSHNSPRGGSWNPRGGHRGVRGNRGRY